MEAIIELPIVAVDGWAFELSKFLKPREDYIDGHELARRVEVMDNLADRFHANHLLLRQNVIPREWRSIIPIFAKTIKHGRFGYLGFPHFCWCEHFQRWYLDSRWLGWGFAKDCRLVRLVPELTLQVQYPTLPSF